MISLVDSLARSAAVINISATSAENEVYSFQSLQSLIYEIMEPKQEDVPVVISAKTTEIQLDRDYIISAAWPMSTIAYRPPKYQQSSIIK